MRAQHDARDVDVIGIPHVARRVVGGDVEQFEVELIRFHLARAVDLEAHITEDAADLAQGLGLGVQPAGMRLAPGQGHIQALAFERMRHAFLCHLLDDGW